MGVATMSRLWACVVLTVVLTVGLANGAPYSSFVGSSAASAKWISGGIDKLTAVDFTWDEVREREHFRTVAKAQLNFTGCPTATCYARISTEPKNWAIPAPSSVPATVAFWWYGGNTGLSFGIRVYEQTSGPYHAPASFNDDFTGWRQLTTEPFASGTWSPRAGAVAGQWTASDQTIGTVSLVIYGNADTTYSHLIADFLITFADGTAVVFSPTTEVPVLGYWPPATFSSQQYSASQLDTAVEGIRSKYLAYFTDTSRSSSDLLHADMETVDTAIQARGSAAVSAFRAAGVAYSTSYENVIGQDPSTGHWVSGGGAIDADSDVLFTWHAMTVEAQTMSHSALRLDLDFQACPSASCYTRLTVDPSTWPKPAPDSTVEEVSFWWHGSNTGCLFHPHMAIVHTYTPRAC